MFYEDFVECFEGVTVANLLPEEPIQTNLDKKTASFIYFSCFNSLFLIFIYFILPKG